MHSPNQYKIPHQVRDDKDSELDSVIPAKAGILTLYMDDVYFL